MLSDCPLQPPSVDLWDTAADARTLTRDSAAGLPPTITTVGVLAARKSSIFLGRNGRVDTTEF